MKIAVAGKGGAGKTTVAGTLARWFGANGFDVVAIDGDDDPDLAVSLGLGNGTAVEPLPNDVVTRSEPAGDEPADEATSYELTRPAGELLEAYAVEAPDGVGLLRGCAVAAGSGSFFLGHVVVSLALSTYDEAADEVVILDMPAHVDYLGVAHSVDALVLVGGPGVASRETLRKLYVVARGIGVPEAAIHIVANDVRSDRERRLVEKFCSERGLDISAVIPHDEAIHRAEQAGVSPVDHDGDSPSVRAIHDLGNTLMQTHDPDESARS